MARATVDVVIHGNKGELVEAVLARRKRHGTSHTLVADVNAKGFNAGLVAAVVALGLASEAHAEWRLRQLLDADAAASRARTDKLNEEAARERLR